MSRVELLVLGAEGVRHRVRRDFADESARHLDSAHGGLLEGRGVQEARRRDVEDRIELVRPGSEVVDHRARGGVQDEPHLFRPRHLAVHRVAEVIRVAVQDDRAGGQVAVRIVVHRAGPDRVRERFLRDRVPDRLPQIHGEDRDGGQGRVHRGERRLGDDADGVRVDLLNPIDLGRVGIQDAARVVLDQVVGEDHVVRGDGMTAVRGIHGVREVRVRDEVERPRDAVRGRFPSVREVRDNAERGVAGDKRAVDIVNGDELEDKSDRVRVQRHGGQAGHADSQRARCLGGVDARGGGRGRGIRDGEERRKQDRRDEDGRHDRRNDSSFTQPPTRVLLLPLHNPTSMARGPNTPARATT